MFTIYKPFNVDAPRKGISVNDNYVWKVLTCIRNPIDLNGKTKVFMRVKH